MFRDFRDNRAVAYLIFRIAIGVNIFGHGFFRILSGVSGFAEGMEKGFGKSPLPMGLVSFYGHAIPYIELVLGVLLILGLFTRVTLALSGLFMVTLTFGTVSTQNWNGAGQQLVYSIVFFMLLWVVEANTLSVDGLIRRRNV